MKIKICLFTIIILFMLSCNGNPETGSFDIYLIRDSEMSITEFDSADIQDIDLPLTPALAISDITTYAIYDYNGLSLSHRVSVNKDVKSILGDSNSIFVLVVNGERRYKGEYWANFMSTYPLDVTLWASSDSIFTIMARDSGKDKINDPEVINALSDYGIEVLYYPLY